MSIDKHNTQEQRRAVKAEDRVGGPVKGVEIWGYNHVVGPTGAKLNADVTKNFAVGGAGATDSSNSYADNAVGIPWTQHAALRCENERLREDLEKASRLILTQAKVVEAARQGYDNELPLAYRRHAIKLALHDLDSLEDGSGE